MRNKIYLLSVSHISAQNFLSDIWFDNPLWYSEKYVRSVEPDYRQYFAPLEVRRYGRLLKRALLVSQKAMESCGITQLDAIITGTGMGCIENTEFFLNDLTLNGEEMLKPTCFMNSTHNTISSLLAMKFKCKGYNSTYAHKGVSFESALQDAFIQLQIEKISTVLVGGHDEMTPDYLKILQKTGYLSFEQHQAFASETAVAMVLGTERGESTLCEIEHVETFYGKVNTQLIASLPTAVDFIMVGTNGKAENDKAYFEFCEKYFPNIPLLQYKNIFGESYTSPAFGVYAAALCLKNERIPSHLFIEAENLRPPLKILCYNQFENKNHSLILLSRC
jgi:hypothetical protein